MTIPARPTFQREGPASPCSLSGRDLKWTQCTPLSTAMGIDRSTLGRVVVSGCQVRSEIDPPDTIGGTNLRQCAAVAEAHGVHVELHVGPSVCTPQYAATWLQAGRGFVLQGNTQPDGRGNVNHAIWVNHSGGGKLGAPTSAMVYDPWSSGPAVWPWSKVLAFAAALRPYGESDPRKLGPGKFYAGIFPDTEPHAHLHFGAVRTAPFPDRVTAYNVNAARRISVRARPDLRAPIVATLKVGQTWDAYQVVHNGAPLAGSRVWYGNHDGNGWVHESGLKGKGGAS